MSESNLLVFNVTIKDERSSKTETQQGQHRVAISNCTSNQGRNFVRWGPGANIYYGVPFFSVRYIQLSYFSQHKNR